jgi:hypothetical protein
LPPIIKKTYLCTIKNDGVMTIYDGIFKEKITVSVALWKISANFGISGFTRSTQQERFYLIIID